MNQEMPITFIFHLKHSIGNFLILVGRLPNEYLQSHLICETFGGALIDLPNKAAKSLSLSFLCGCELRGPVNELACQKNSKNTTVTSTIHSGRTQTCEIFFLH